MASEQEKIDIIKSLIDFVPEITKPSDFAEVFGQDEEYLKQDDGAPFLSEAFLYAVLGKDDARSVLSRLSKMLKVLGYENMARRVY